LREYNSSVRAWLDYLNGREQFGHMLAERWPVLGGQFEDRTPDTRQVLLVANILIACDEQTESVRFSDAGQIPIAERLPSDPGSVNSLVRAEKRDQSAWDVVIQQDAENGHAAWRIR